MQLQREADEFATRKNQAFVSILTKAQIQRLGDPCSVSGNRFQKNGVPQFGHREKKMNLPDSSHLLTLEIDGTSG